MNMTNDKIPFAVTRCEMGTRIDMSKEWLSDDECEMLAHELTRSQYKSSVANSFSDDYDGVVVSGKNGLPVLPRQGSACDKP